MSKENRPNQANYQKLGEEPNQYPVNANYRPPQLNPVYQPQNLILNAQPVFNNQMPIYQPAQVS